MASLQTKVDEHGRVCTKCRDYKTWDHYHSQWSGPSGYASSCKSCRKEYYKLHPLPPSHHRDSKRNRLLINRYGIGLQDCHEMVSNQGGKCEICGCEISMGNISMEGRQMANLDHDHTTGRIRGMLCVRCNSGIGMFNDNVFILQKSIDYLHKYQVERSI